MSWQGGAGYVRGPYHVYAKDDNLSNGYGGYCFSAIRPCANRKYLVPCTVFPHLPPDPSGVFAQTRNYLRNRETRSRLHKAMKNEVVIPEGQQWNRLRPQTRSPQFRPIVQSWQSGLKKIPAAATPNFLGCEGEQPRVRKVLQDALDSSDPVVVSWAVAHTKSPEVTTVEGTKRAGRNSIRSSAPTTKNGPRKSKKCME